MSYKHLYDNDHEAAALLTTLIEPGDTVVRSAVQDYGAGEAIEFILDGEHAAGSPNADAQRRMLPRIREAEHGLEVIRKAADLGIAFITPEHNPTEFPARLRYDGIGDHSPVGLWVKGRPLALDEIDKPLAFVGARAATSYGEHVTDELVSFAVNHGHTIVSGAAYGIDGAAHRAALMSGGRTVAFLAGGLDRPYPAGHYDLIERITINGSIISECAPGMSPTKWRFLARNRLIAAVSDGTIVVESGMPSGSLNAANWTKQIGGKLMAVPGPITSAASTGTNQLIHDGAATAVASWDHIEGVLNA